MRLLGWFVALAAVILITWLIWGGAWETKFTMAGATASLENAGSWGWAAGIGLLIADLLLPVPGTVVMSALGFVYGAVLGGLFAAAGSFLAGLCGYGVGRLFGERGARRLLGAKDFERGQHFFAKGGGWLIAASRAMPILPEALACTAGLVRMPLGRFVLALVCGCVPVGFIFAIIGAIGHVSPGWAMAASILLPAAIWVVADRVKRRLTP